MPPKPHYPRGYGALFAAVLFPCFAYWVLDRLRPGLPIVGFLLVSLISLVGGMSVAGLLNGLPKLRLVANGNFLWGVL